MSPWDIIGWAIVLGSTGVTTLIVVTFVARSSAHLLRSLRDRRTPVAAGQVWDQDGTRLTIREVYPNGRIGITTGDRISGASWADDPDEWERRKRQRRLTLVRR